MRTRIALLIIAIIAIVGLGVTALLYNRPDSHPSADLHVVAGENFWGDIASQIGGDHVAVTSIMSDPSADPHLYESSANDASAIASAAVVIKNGVDYDDFIDKLLSASPDKERIVISAEQAAHVTGNNPNPHLWYNLAYVQDVAQAIEQAFASKDATHSSDYKDNLQKFLASLQPISDVLAQIKSKYSGAPVAYTERVPGYLLDAAGLTVKTPASFAGSIEDGSDPTPKDTAIMESLMTNHGVRVLLYNSQATSDVTQHVRDLAKQAGIPIVGVSETIPADETHYQSWQLDQAKALLKALGD